MTKTPKSVLLRSSADDAIATSEQAIWARSELAAALRERGIAAVESGSADLTVTITGDAGLLGVDVPRVAEAFALVEKDGGIIAWGFDARGLVYALTELADRVRHAGEGDLFGALPLIEQPATRIRSISRCFVSETEDKAWFNDRTFWTDYLTMLATNRFNRFSLTLGIEYDYPYHNNLISDVYLHFPYPYLMALPGYDIRVVELPEAERDANFDMLRFIGREAKRRGLDFQIGLWTQRYDFDDVPNANYTVEGVTDANLAPYVRDALTTMLREVPEITGLTFRIHVEGGIAEGDYDFWRVAFDGVKAAGRTIEINMHAKGLDDTTLDVARDTGLPVSVSPKYLAEHIGLPYHPSAIREREYPPAEAMTNREKLSVGSRRFTRQTYGDFLRADRDWQVLHRVWPGSQRVLAWGDPVFAASYGRSASFCGSDGIEWFEPLSFKGRMGSGIPGGRSGYKQQGLATKYDWQKYEYQYRLWGRRGFSPDTGDDGSGRYLAHHLGDAAGAVEAALSSASRILPLIVQTHGPSIANNNYWPEVYTNISVFGAAQKRPYGFDMDAPTRFGNAPTFDPQMFANAREYAAALPSGQPRRSYTPLDVADWLEGLAGDAERALVEAKACADFHTAPVQRLVVDAGIAAAVGRFFAEKQRAAVWAEIFLATRARAARMEALGFVRRARLAWATVAQLSRDVYQADLTFGPGAHLRGSWQDRLADIDAEINEINVWRDEDGPEVTHSLEQAKAAMAALRGRRATVGSALGLNVPETFKAGEPVTISVGATAGKAVLHYRHVNQAERWQSVEMVAGQGTIPGEYTASAFHLQVYVTVVDGDTVTMVPGFTEDLANVPYQVVMRE